MRVTSPLDAARAVWAKTDRLDPDRWLSLPQHLTDSFEVACWLWENRLAPHVRRRLAQTVGGEDTARALATFLAGVHDIGKVSPAFEVQAISTPGHEYLGGQLRDAGFTIESRVALERHAARHELVGQLALGQWLRDVHGWDSDSARSLASVVGGHHGKYPARAALMRARERPHLVGEGLWENVRRAVLDDLADRTDFADVLAHARPIEIDAPGQVLLTGFVIMSDWIASNERFFDYNPLATDLDTRAPDALTRLDLTPLWSPQPPPSAIDDHLHARFDLPEAATARPVQRAAADLLEATDAPGLFIIEAGMGVGKTEAALLLAERLASRLGLSGVFFALPSMSTSDAIFTRVLNWVHRLPDLTGERTSVRLAHSKAALNDTYEDLLARGRISGIAEDSDSHNPEVIAHTWFHGRKQALLADFAVGTIDQVLMAALQSKHVMLRHLGLAGKVVIVDECHAADEYMAVYLDRSLEWLGAMGVPVILLSATLPGRRRAAMAEAYDVGRGATTRRRLARPGSPYDALRADERYPLLTATTSGPPLTVEVETETRSSTLTVTALDDDLNSLADLLGHRLSDGGCAVVIRNTVTRAQETFRHLRDKFGEDVTLTHSRFVTTDRMANDRRLVQRFGPPEHDSERPLRHIVVATQVIEQSLDVDFDLMVTDIAPLDLILQRSGRLHRHDRNSRPAKVAEPELFVTGVDWQTDVPEIDPGAINVYGEDSLLRSLAVLDVTSRPRLNLPGRIAKLVQSAYADQCPVPPGWEDRAARAARSAAITRTKREGDAAAFLLDPPSQENLNAWDWQTPGDWKSETRGRAAVRDGRESVEVIVVQRRGDGHVYRWNAPEGEPPLPTGACPEHEQARLAARATVVLPPALTYPGRIDRTIAELETHFYFEEWQASPWLREQLIVEFDENGRCVLADSDLTYDALTGLSLQPRPAEGKDDHEH